MHIQFTTQRLLWLLALSSSLLVLSSCSPKIKLGIWAKRHQGAATALGIWAANNPLDATGILNLDCRDAKEFKKKINDALSGSAQTQQPAQQSRYDVTQHNYHYGNSTGQRNSSDGFVDWCRKYPKAAKRLRSHAKALCKAGLGILSGKYKVN